MSKSVFEMSLPLAEGLTIGDAVKIICKEINTDAGYRESWKAAIAMSFKDEYARRHQTHGIHDIANAAAEDFLNLLSRTVEEEIK